MDAHLIHQLNRAVDRGDELVKRDLLAKAGQVERFLASFHEEDPRLTEILKTPPPAFKEDLFIAYLVRILGIYLTRMKGKNKLPRWVRAWYQKARAWHFAVNLSFWDEPSEPIF